MPDSRLPDPHERKNHIFSEVNLKGLPVKRKPFQYKVNESDDFFTFAF
jgi:hypothetical protein